MKILGLTILFFLSVFTNYGQDRKLSLGIAVSPDFYQYNNKTAGIGKYQAKFSYTTGVRIQYDFIPKFSANTGVFYSVQQYNLDYRGLLIAASPNDPSIPVESKIKISYLVIPLLVQYDILNKEKLSFYGSGGINTGFSISNSVTSLMANGAEKSVKYKMGNTTLTGQLALGLKCNIREKCFLFIEPSIMYKFLNANNGFSPFSYGTMLGFSFYLT